MAHTSLNHYLQQFDSSIQDKKGALAAELLSFRHPHVANPRLCLENPEPSVQKALDFPFDEIVVAHLRAVWAVNCSDFMDAYRFQALLVQAFTKVFQSQKDENWAIPIMHTVCLDLRLFANYMGTRSFQKEKGKPEDLLENAAELLMGIFRVCASDNRTSPEDSKRKGMLILVNQLFKIYFKINKLHLCKPLIRAIESSNIKEQSEIAQVVTYKYFVGRKAIFDSDFKTADECLTYAFEHCHNKCQKNKRQILINLLPVKMLLGQMPKPDLLKKYDLVQFEEVVQAVKDGNLLRLKNAMATHDTYFIKCGVYQILEKLNVITYRNLFKKVFLLLKTHQIPLECFLTALKFMEMDDMDLDEVECITVNLIYEGKIKGYISHQHRKLVVSKQNPFPPLSSLS